MKKITTVLVLFVAAVMFTSCNNKQTLQEYLVESQEKTGFMTFDIPVNFFQPKSDQVSEEVMATIKSIRKINVVGLPFKNNEEIYEAEKAAMKEIFKDADKYKSLMSVKVQGYNVKLYYTGNSDAIDEVIAFGYAKEQGVGIARILGDDMNPSLIIKMLDQIKMDGSGMNLNQFTKAFK
tara:strand:+ start:33296 stop:33832 length:537 start_codon:yes stop_codon:yes gene_type:complete